MSEDQLARPLYDLAYVQTCVAKAIERVAEDYKFDSDNTYYHIEWADDSASPVPACLVGQILSDIGVDEELKDKIALFHNAVSIRELTNAVDLPLDEPALRFLDQVQQLNDTCVPWHRILEEVSAT